MVAVKSHELRKKTRSDLQSQLNSLKSDLQDLRIAKVTGGGPAKLAKIGVVRKSIARVMTVMNQQTKLSLREQYADKKNIPKELREKKTRAIRRRLTPAQVRLKFI